MSWGDSVLDSSQLKSQMVILVMADGRAKSLKFLKKCQKLKISEKVPKVEYLLTLFQLKSQLEMSMGQGHHGEMQVLSSRDWAGRVLV